MSFLKTLSCPCLFSILFPLCSYQSPPINPSIRVSIFWSSFAWGGQPCCSHDGSKFLEICKLWLSGDLPSRYFYELRLGTTKMGLSLARYNMTVYYEIHIDAWLVESTSNFQLHFKVYDNTSLFYKVYYNVLFVDSSAYTVWYFEYST